MKNYKIIIFMVSMYNKTDHGEKGLGLEDESIYQAWLIVQNND